MLPSGENGENRKPSGAMDGPFTDLAGRVVNPIRNIVRFGI